MANDEKPQEINPNKLLLPHEAAKELRIHPETCRNWLRLGKVPGAIKVGRGWRIPLAAIERLLREGCMPVLNSALP